MKATIIGSGLSGSAAARIFAEAGYKVTVYEKKEHISGSVYDYIDENGIFIHKYGPHIFHTNSDAAYEFITRFCEWNIYKHRVEAKIGDRLCPVPFNFTSIDLCFDRETADKYKNKLLNEYGKNGTVTIGELLENSDNDLLTLAEFVYENVFLHYTEKQWGMTPAELGGNVMRRVPIRTSYESGYFNDKYQLMPSKGYTYFVKKLLDHENIEVKLNIDADKMIAFDGENLIFNGETANHPVIYTGCVDRLLDYRYGALPYRSLRFEFKKAEWQFQPVSVVNYPNEHEYTRITEFGHFYPAEYKDSALLYEYPMSFDHTRNQDPYYPIPNKKNEDLYIKYLNDISSVKNFYLAGRLGSYKYINMDSAILCGIDAAEKIIKQG